MSLNAALRLMAGTVIVASLALAVYVNFNWLLLTAFVGFNLLQSAFTGWCPAITAFQKMGLKQEPKPDQGMSVNQGVHIIAGAIVLATSGAVFFEFAPFQLLILTGIVGLSLVQSAFSGWCPAITIARLMGFKPAN